VRRASRRHVLGVLGERYWVLALAAPAATVAMWMTGDRSWLLGAMLTTSLLALGLPLLAWRAHVRNGLATIARLPERSSDFSADAHGFTIANPVGHVTLSWRELRLVRRDPEFWLLQLAENQFVTVPLANASADDLARLEGYVRDCAVPLK
jgi:hypothetical protein